jgi:hypothetical protein
MPFAIPTSHVAAERKDLSTGAAGATMERTTLGVPSASSGDAEGVRGSLYQNKPKILSVRWKDLSEDRDGKSMVDDEGDIMDDGSSLVAAAAEPKKKQKAATKRVSPPPPAEPLTAAELRQQIARQEALIKQACKLELHLLNQSKQVREKRGRMVTRLIRMKRKVAELYDSSDGAPATNRSDGFVLPPVYCPPQKGARAATTSSASASPYVIDMTQAEPQDGGILSS